MDDDVLTEMEEWQAAHNVSRKELAKRLPYSYVALCGVFTGKRKLSKKLAERMREIMREDAAGLKIVVPPEYESRLKRLARTVNMSVDEYVLKIMDDFFKP